MCGLAGLIQARSIVYRPQSNGRAERVVQSIINSFKLYSMFRKPAGYMPYHLPCGVLMTYPATSHPTEWLLPGTTSLFARYPP